jgi:hypothetical protein
MRGWKELENVKRKIMRLMKGSGKRIHRDNGGE